MRQDVSECDGGFSGNCEFGNDIRNLRVELDLPTFPEVREQNRGDRFCGRQPQVDGVAIHRDIGPRFSDSVISNDIAFPGDVDLRPGVESGVNAFLEELACDGGVDVEVGHRLIEDYGRNWEIVKLVIRNCQSAGWRIL